MRQLMDRLFGLYATEATLVHDDQEQTVCVFLQSINSRSWQNMEQRYSTLGKIPGGQYVCILPAGTAAEGDTLRVGSKSYRICRVEEMTVKSCSVYQWGLCNEKGGEDNWGSES